jgi:hypothetical protein
MAELLADQMVDLSRKVSYFTFPFHLLPPPEKSAVGKPTPRPAVFRRVRVAAINFTPRKQLAATPFCFLNKFSLIHFHFQQKKFARMI